MSGIAGILGVSIELARPALARMRHALSHRGTDQTSVQIPSPRPEGRDGFFVQISPRRGGETADAAGSDAAPSAVANHAVLDGVIFNDRELRETLAHNGWPCRSANPDKVLLCAYSAWGVDCVGHFHGMFACCVADPQRGTVWLCRDRLGKRHLYLTRPRTGGLLFASELRAILAAGPDLVPATLSLDALEGVLTQGAVCGMDSIVENIRLLAPGESLTTDWAGQQLAAKSYWRIPFTPEAASPYFPNPSSHAHAVQTLSETLRYAVKISLQSDSSTGILLSGRRSSAALATVASDVAGGPLRTLHVAFESGTESNTATAVARALGTEHQTIQYSTDEVLADFPKVLASVDQPGISGFQTYFLARAAARAGFKAIATGLGGNELFAGDASFVAVPRAVRLARWMRYSGVLGQLLGRALGKLRSRRAVRYGEMLRRQPTMVAFYLLRREIFTRAQRREFFDRPARIDQYSGLPLEVMLDLTLNCSGMDAVNQISYLELATRVRHMALRDLDVMGTANDVQIQIPLLDHRIVELVAALPGFLKRQRHQKEGLLIEAVGPRFPASAFLRQKPPCGFPWDAWLRGPLRTVATKAVQNSDLWAQLGLAPDRVRNIWTRFLANDRRIAAAQIVTLITMEDFSVRHDIRGSVARLPVHVQSLVG